MLRRSTSRRVLIFLLKILFGVLGSRCLTGSAVTTVDTEGTNTVAVTAKADGRSTTTRQNPLLKGVLTPQPSFATVARSNKYRSQHVGSDETKYD